MQLLAHRRHGKRNEPDELDLLLAVSSLVVFGAFVDRLSPALIDFVDQARLGPLGLVHKRGRLSG